MNANAQTLPEVSRPDTKDLVFSDLIGEVNALEVVDQDTQLRMSELILSLGQKRRIVTDRFAPPKRQADGVKRFLLDLEKMIVDPISQAEALGQQKNRTYREEERRKADELRRELERKALDQEKDRKLADAIEAEEKGNIEEAESIMNEPVTAPVIEVPPAIAKAQGTTLRVTWRGVGRDLKALVKQIAGVKELARPDLLGLLEFNGPAANKLAAAQRENMAVDGVDAIRDEKEVATGR